MMGGLNLQIVLFIAVSMLAGLTTSHDEIANPLNVSITVEMSDDETILKCLEKQDVKWRRYGEMQFPNYTRVNKLPYVDASSDTYECKINNGYGRIVVKVRTCHNCVELDTATVVGIVMGDLVATFLIGVAVYCISSQPKGRTYSTSKASDRVNLIPGDGLYQPLSANHDSEYSKLDRRPRRK
ncbi:CD3D protein, partial [Amia calva]|nr:CD3D protein [Amia calva]